MVCTVCYKIVVRDFIVNILTKYTIIEECNQNMVYNGNIRF